MDTLDRFRVKAQRVRRQLVAPGLTPNRRRALMDELATYQRRIAAIERGLRTPGVSWRRR